MSRGACVARWAARGASVVLAVVAVDAVAAVALRRARVLPDPAELARVAPSARRLLDRPYARPGWRVADRPHRDRYVVAILGGSVADDVADVAATELASALGPRVAPRRVELINLAVPGGTQPAQLNLLGVSHHRVDAAVVLDGFNEVAQGGYECATAERFWAARGARPSGELAEPVVDRVRRYVDLFESVRAWRWSALSQIARLRANAVATGDVLDGFRAPPGVPAPSRLDTQPSSLDVRTPPEALAARWGACVEATHRLARAWEVSVVFLLQPNQRARTARRFTDAERACCLRGDARYAAVAERYDALAREVARLRAAGLPVASLTEVFDDEPEAVWRDECCHVNPRGNVLLARAAAARAAELLASAPAR